MKPTVIDYDKNSQTIKNLSALPSGTGCKFLLVIAGIEEGEFIAKQWKRQVPLSLNSGETVIQF